ncbi:MAG: type II CAAX endopeptidase family protein [Chlamydiota bacterium]|nr:type II CAAX endopeptidase family protein [Chlamydiota bacterium]
MSANIPTYVINGFLMVLVLGVLLNITLLPLSRRNKKQVCAYVPWGIIDIIAVLLFVIGLQILIVIIPSMGIDQVIGVSKEISGTYVVEIVGISFLVLLLRRRYGIYWDTLGFKKSGNMAACIWSIIYYISAIPWIILMALITAFLADKLGIQLEPQQITKMLLSNQSWCDFILTCFLVMIIAPVGEEIFFRGFVYPVMKRWMGLGFSAVFNALFFSLLHYNIYAFLPVFVIGIFLVLLYEKTGNIISVMLFHITFNSMSLVLLKVIYGVVIK